jgi:hypothetical protein
MNSKFFLLLAFLNINIFPQSDGNNFSNQGSSSSSVNLQKLKYDFSSLNLNQQRPDAESILFLMNDETPSRKSPWLAFGLSILYPGLGQLYNAQYGKALLMGGLGTIGLGLLMLAAMSTDYDSESNPDYIAVMGYTGVAIWGGAYIWSLIDAPISASNINERNRKLGVTIFSTLDETFALRFRSGNKLSNQTLAFTFNF